MNDPRTEGRGFSRRAFLKGSGAVAAAAAAPPLGEKAVAQAQEAPAAQGPGAAAVTFTVNGKSMTAQLEPRVTLLDALRDFLDVTGCKRVCDRGSCGACTVLLDGKPVYSCSMLAIQAQGKSITTVEGLSDGVDLAPIQEAFWKNDASQCGFCTPGFVTACSAVLKENPKPSMEQVKRGLDGNICRCGTYEQMAHALSDLIQGGGR